MLKREVLWRCVVFVLCVCFVGAAALVSPGGVRADEGEDAEAARAEAEMKAFAELCEKGTAEQVKQALKDGADPKARDDAGRTALMLAAGRCEPESVRLLLEAGADVNAANGGWTALLAAAEDKNADPASKRVETVRALLAAGAKPDAADEDDGETALMRAARHGDIEAVRLLLEAGANVNAVNRNGRPALLAMTDDEPDNAPSDKALFETVRALLAAGADVRVQTEDGENALSAHAGNGAAFRLLLEAGADVNQRHQNGRTPLMSAAASGRPDAVRTLLDAGADRSLKDDEGHDAAWHARQYEAEFDYEGAEKDAARTRAAILRLLQGGGKKKPAAKRR